MRHVRPASAKSFGGDITPPAPALRALFPYVDGLRIELEFSQDSGCSPSNQVRVLYPAARASFRYPCPFPGCNGWFDLQEPAQAFLQGRGESLTGQLLCTGVRPQDRALGKHCQLQVTYRMVASYADSKV
jgi:hypothetical protein